MKLTKFYLIVILVVIFALAGCKPAATPAPTLAPTEAAPTEAAPTEAAPTEAEATVTQETEEKDAAVPTEATEAEAAEPAETVSVSFWYPYGEGSWTGDFLARKIAAFNEANPGIKVVGHSYQDYASIIEGIQRGAAAKDLPSIASIAFGYDDYLVGSGIAYPIEDYLGDDAEDFLTDFFPALLDVTTTDGKVYGIPLALSVAEVFYHPAIFEKAGLDPKAPPQSWDEMIAAAKKIKEETNINGLTFAPDDSWIFETAVRSSGADLINADGSPNLDSPEAVKVLSDWAAGVADGSILYNADFMQTLQTFGAGQVAMFAVSSYGTVYYHDNLPEVAAMSFPAAEGQTYKSPAGGNSLYLMGNNEAERTAAATFIKYLTNPEAIAEWAINSGYLPTRNSSLAVMADFIEGFDNYKLAVDSINNVVPPTKWPSRQAMRIEEAIMQNIEAALLGQKNAETALTDANSEIATVLSQ